MSDLAHISYLDEQRDQHSVEVRRRKPCESFDLDALTEFNLKRLKFYLGLGKDPRVPKKKISRSGVE